MDFHTDRVTVIQVISSPPAVLTASEDCTATIRKRSGDWLGALRQVRFFFVIFTLNF